MFHKFIHTCQSQVKHSFNYCRETTDRKKRKLKKKTFWGELRTDTFYIFLRKLKRFYKILCLTSLPKETCYGMIYIKAVIYKLHAQNIRNGNPVPIFP